jgi:hypothetical protein
MLSKFVAHLRANVIAYVALFFALGGTAYAVPRSPVLTSSMVRWVPPTSASRRPSDRRTHQIRCRMWIRCFRAPPSTSHAPAR